MSVLRLDRNKYYSINQVHNRKPSQLLKKTINNTTSFERRSRSVRQKSTIFDNEEDLKRTIHIKSAVSFNKK